MKRFSAIWKSKYTDQFNSDDDVGNVRTEWIGILSNISCLDIKGGIKRCKAKYAWPPEVSEFLQEAKTEKREGCHKLFDKPALPDKSKQNKDVAQKHVDKIKESLGIFYKGDG